MAKKIRTRTAFIVSTGRTGTGFVTRLVNQTTENGFGLHEPSPAFRRRSRKLMSDPFALSHLWYFKLTRHRLLTRKRTDWYVESNFQLFAAVPLLRRAFPGAVVVHILRDPRDVATSYLNRYRYVCSDHITPCDVPDDPNREAWKDWNPVQKLAWYWMTVVQHVDNQKPDLTVRFEDIFGGKKDGAFQLLDALPGLRYDRDMVYRVLDEKVNVNEKTFFPDFPDWPKQWQQQFMDITGDTMKRFGYDPA